MIQMKELGRMPWPRGLCFANGLLMALARGRPRGAGGPDPNIDDKAGTIFKVQMDGSGIIPIHTPTDPPLRLWDKKLPAYQDIETDRPYAGLVWHEASKNYFICGFSGIDKPTSSVAFRKNASDAVFRYDTRINRWFEVERHNPNVVPENIRRSLTTSIPNQYFPSDSSGLHAGWLNGPDGLMAHNDSLYVVGKDNHSLIRYGLNPLIEDPAHGPIKGDILRKDSKEVFLPEGPQDVFDGPSSLATDGEILYVGLRTTDMVLGFPLSGPFEKAVKIAQLPKGVELIDMKIGISGELYISSKRKKIWNIGVPDVNSTYIADETNVFAELPGNCSNIALGKDDQLYVCCNVNGGAIFQQVDEDLLDVL